MASTNVSASPIATPTPTDILIPTPTEASNISGHHELVKHIVLSTLNATANNGSMSNLTVTNKHHHHPHHMISHSDKIYTFVYIGLAFFVVSLVGFISTVYMRALKEQRKEQNIRLGIVYVM